MTHLLDGETSTYIGSVLEHFGIGGGAVSVIWDGEVFVHPFGTTGDGSQTAITSETLFSIGDCSRSFTAIAIALLVDEGALQWDDPIRRHLPEFSLHQSWASDQATIRDLLSMRLGLDRQNILDWGGRADLSTPELLSRVAAARPVRGFREGFSESPVCYALLARIIEQVADKSLTDFLRERILIPLGMTATVIGVPDAPDARQIVRPHVFEDNTVVALNAPRFGGWLGASGIYLSPADAARWLLFHVRRGWVGDGPLVVRKSMDEIVRSHATGIPDHRLGEQFRDFCLGWTATDFKGQRTTYINGWEIGSCARFTIIQKHKLGISVALSSRSRTALRAISYRVADRFLGAQPTDWAPKLRTWDREDDERQNFLLAQDYPATADSRSLDLFPGTYANKVSGSVTVRLEAAGLYLDVRDGEIFNANLKHLGGATFTAEPIRGGIADSPVRVRFEMEGDDVRELVHSGLGRLKRLPS